MRGKATKMSDLQQFYHQRPSDLPLAKEFKATNKATKGRINRIW